MLVKQTGYRYFRLSQSIKYMILSSLSLRKKNDRAIFDSVVVLKSHSREKQSRCESALMTSELKLYPESKSSHFNHPFPNSTHYRPVVPVVPVVPHRCCCFHIIAQFVIYSGPIAVFFIKEHFLYSTLYIYIYIYSI